MASMTDHRCNSFSPIGRSEWRTGRWAGIGALAMTLGTLTLGLVYASRTQPASAVGTGASSSASPPAPLTSPQRLKAVRRVTVPTTLPTPSLVFVKNYGELDSRIGYYVHGQETTLYFTPQGLTVALTGSRPSPGIVRKAAWGRELIAKSEAAASARWVVTLDFVGANPELRPQWQEPTPAIISPLTNPQLQEKTGRPADATVRYRDVWPGIDLLYTTTGGRLHSTFLVKPGADPNRIQFAYHGITAVRRTEADQLQVITPMGSFSEEMPTAYQESHYLAHLARLKNGLSEEMPVASQERDGQQVEVAVAYTLETVGDTSVHGIHVGAYDPNTTLIIDRVVRYPGYDGGSDADVSPGLAVDHAGAHYASASPTPPKPPSRW
ncbi:MAG: hypothetical protein KGL32_07935 [candidate division NC10 bacterium]|nr:hypothetical protein [candidate division NC10 bacterium]